MLDTTTATEYLAANLTALLSAPGAMEEIAERAGVPLAHLRSMLAGAMLPCPRTLGRLAGALNTTPAELYREPTS